MSPLSLISGRTEQLDDKSKVKQQDAGGGAGTGASLPIPGFSQRAQTGPKSKAQGLPIQLAGLCSALGRPHRRSANHILDIMGFVYLFHFSGLQ